MFKANLQMKLSFFLVIVPSLPLVGDADIEDDNQEADDPDESKEQTLHADQIVCAVSSCGQLAPAYGLAGVMQAEVGGAVAVGQRYGAQADQRPQSHVDQQPVPATVLLLQLGQEGFDARVHLTCN